MITAYQARTKVEESIKRLQDPIEKCLKEIEFEVDSNRFNAFVDFNSGEDANKTKEKMKELGYKVSIKKNNSFRDPITFTMEIKW